MRLLVLFFTYLLFFTGFEPGLKSQPQYSYTSAVPDSCWADSVLNSLSLNEKIGQLIFVRANKDNTILPEIPDLIRKYNIGGVVFFKGGPLRQAQLTNSWQQMARTPLFVSIDAERGLAMRLDSTSGFPYMMTLGACSDDSLVYRVSSEIARGCRRMGIHINFGPVVDINSNPKNPVINSRSFGESKESVTRKSLMYLNGLKDHQILHTAKHFPGHGDTDSDSHFTLPVINHNQDMLDTVDLYPYYHLMGHGLEGVMVAHILVPALDSAKNAASSLSSKIITGLLREKMGFRGLIFTDALEMKGVTNYYQPGEIEVKALQAGNDVLLMPLDVEKAVAKIRQAVDSCLIWPEDIDEKCLKILKFKQKYIPLPWKPTETSQLVKDLTPPENEVLYRKIMTSAFTLVRNNHDLIPFQRLDTLKTATLCIGTSAVTSYQQVLGQYAPLDHYCLPANATIGVIDTLLLNLASYNLVILGFVNNSISAERNFGLSSSGLQMLSCLQEQNKLVVTFFGNPYALGKLGSLPAAEVIIAAYQDNEETYRLAAQALFGLFPFRGHLPVTASADYHLGKGMHTQALNRLRYSLPEECGIYRSDLLAIDSIIQDGITQGAYPGCQVLFACDGQVFYHKAFGKPTYNDSLAVKLNDLYDIASVTKVAATTLAVMKLYEEGKVDLEQKISHYLPYLKKSNKKGLVLRDILTHQARLKPWIPFFSKVIQNGKPDTAVFHTVPDSLFSVKVAQNLYMKVTYLDSIRSAIIQSPLEKKQDYLYSDLGFYLLKEVVEKVSGEPFDEYLDRNFYRPLGLSTMTFNPLEHFPLNRIIPTENDTVFRGQLVRGFVHDPGAAMLGGISGHAGLFSDANDLAIILQMLVNGGNYGGHQFLKPETIKEFTSVQFPEFHNRRGLGFDKPPLETAENGPCGIYASASSFGHSGFTGTYIWADPDKKLVFIFLSNRLNPLASNNKLSNLNIRTSLYDMFYQLVLKAEEKK